MPLRRVDACEVGSSCRRRTYFLSGFDPRGVAHYQRLFARLLKQQGWRLGSRQEGERITSWPLLDPELDENYELIFLHWDDIARANWPKHPWPLLAQLLGFAWTYLIKGGLVGTAQLCPGVALCGLYPILFLVLIILVAAVGAVLAAVFWLPLAPLVAAGVLWQGWRAADRLGVVWLCRSILFTHRIGSMRDNMLRQRVQELVEALLALEQMNLADEILLVGHSSGSFVLAMVAAELRRHPNAVEILSRLRLLSLGQNLANLGLYPGAESFRDDLKALAIEPCFPWLDVTSFDDLLCFAGVNPYQACGLPVPRRHGIEYPHMQLLNLRQANGLQRKRQWLAKLFDLHFDYLTNPASGIDLCGLMTGESMS